jgi:hypothetical protein
MRILNELNTITELASDYLSTNNQQMISELLKKAYNSHKVISEADDYLNRISECGLLGRHIEFCNSIARKEVLDKMGNKYLLVAIIGVFLKEDDISDLHSDSLKTGALELNRVASVRKTILDSRVINILSSLAGKFDSFYIEVENQYHSSVDRDGRGLNNNTSEERVANCVVLSFTSRGSYVLEQDILVEVETYLNDQFLESDPTLVVSKQGYFLGIRIS